MRPASPKRAAQNRVYARRRRVFLEEHPRCSFPAGCTQAATEVHHRRGRVGALLLDESSWSAICRDHHRWITEHPAAAVEMGISELRLGIGGGS